MNPFPRLLSFLLVVSLSAAERPNIVFILADDMGYGDVQALNPDSEIPTPNLNRLAKEGMTFTDAHSPSAVCTPTRYATLTGRYSWRSRLKSGVQNGYGTPLIEPERPTVASHLKAHGYHTAVIGKWHLGLGFQKDAAGKWDWSKRLSYSPVDVGFDRSINPYRGCEHSCIYCFARPTHAYLGLSPGLDFETRILAKPDASRLLDRELRCSTYQCRSIALGTNTDPYQPVERGWRVTRSILEVLRTFKHPFTIVTKSALVVRDLDIIAPIAAERLARVVISITTLDRRLARSMEPRAATPTKRLETVRRLVDAGVPTSVMVAPLIPALNDSEVEKILQEAAKSGAASASYVLLRLPREIKELFYEWLHRHQPLKAEGIIAHIRETRGGRDYDSTFRKRQTGEGPYAELLVNRFRLASRRLGLDRELVPLDSNRFQVPIATQSQMSLFD